MSFRRSIGAAGWSLVTDHHTEQARAELRAELPLLEANNAALRGLVASLLSPQVVAALGATAATPDEPGTGPVDAAATSLAASQHLRRMDSALVALRLKTQDTNGVTHV
ncbi:MAG: hypothetical protein ABI632_08210 [Pseudolysinimonas sp.]